MRGDLEKREGPAPFRSAALAFLLIGGLLLLMLVSGWLYAGLSGAVITTVLGAIALMLVHKVSPQFFLLLGGARSIDPEDMPALFDIIAVLCRRAGITQIPSLYFLPSGRDIERASDLTEVSGNEIPRIGNAARLLLNLAAQYSIPELHVWWSGSSVSFRYLVINAKLVTVRVSKIGAVGGAISARA